MRSSLAYRENESAIIRGDVPEKYTRLLPFITGNRVLEFGSAEGVLASMLALSGKQVTAIEKSIGRHESAKTLAGEWGVSGVAFINGKMIDHLARLDGIDTLVGVRVIYYLIADLDPVFAAVSEKVPHVVLCGNRNRAAKWRAGIPNPHNRVDNYYASAEGMKDVLTRHGYRIADEVTDGDPIIVGTR
jgi:hypothetical protein